MASNNDDDDEEKKIPPHNNDHDDEEKKMPPPSFSGFEQPAVPWNVDDVSDEPTRRAPARPSFDPMVQLVGFQRTSPHLAQSSFLEKSSAQKTKQDGIEQYTLPPKLPEDPPGRKNPSPVPSSFPGWKNPLLAPSSFPGWKNPLLVPSSCPAWENPSLAPPSFPNQPSATPMQQERTPVPHTHSQDSSVPSAGRTFTDFPTHTTNVPCKEDPPGDRGNRASHLDPGKNLLTVFQASPLAYVRDDDKVFSIKVTLDLALERRILKETLEDTGTNVELNFETATPAALGSFLAKGEGRVMHISCHGHRDYLALDNGSGALHQVGVLDLHPWIQAGRRNLDFVFVSACFSRSTGDAFVQAGVPHVVCCQDDSQLADSTAIEFTRVFYQALASGKFLDEAFEFARRQVVVTTTVPDRHVEMQNFALLPVGADHHVPVFTKSLGPRLPRQRSLSQSRFIPFPPHIFKGRNIDVLKVLEALKKPHVIRVTGPSGIGKLSLVTFACSYHRCIYPNEDMLWVPSLYPDEGDELCVNLMEIYGLLKDKDVSEDLHDNLSYQGSRQKLVYTLQSRRAVIVINTKNLPLPGAKKKLCIFLEDLIQGIPKVRVIVIHNSGDNFPVRKCPCHEIDIVLEPVDLEATVDIFGIMCPHVWQKRHPDVSNADQLHALLLPQEDGMCFYRHRHKRNHKIFDMLGSGNPEEIRQRAKKMTAKEYDTLTKIGLRLSSRVALEKRRAELVRDKGRAVEAENFRRAQSFQQSLDEIDVLLETMPNLFTLKSTRASLKNKQSLALAEMDLNAAAKLQEEVALLDAQIKIEKDDYGEHIPRAFVEAQLRGLESQEEEASEALAFQQCRELRRKTFQQCRELRRKIKEMEARLTSIPTIEELTAKSEVLEADMESSRLEYKYDEAEDICDELESVKAQIRREKEAEEELGIKRVDNNAGVTSQEAPLEAPPDTNITASFFMTEQRASTKFPLGSPLLRDDTADDSKLPARAARYEARSSASAEATIVKLLPSLSNTASMDDQKNVEDSRDKIVSPAASLLPDKPSASAAAFPRLPPKISPNELSATSSTQIVDTYDAKPGASKKLVTEDQLQDVREAPSRIPAAASLLPEADLFGNPDISQGRESSSLRRGDGGNGEDMPEPKNTEYQETLNLETVAASDTGVFEARPDPPRGIPASAPTTVPLLPRGVTQRPAVSRRAAPRSQQVLPGAIAITGPDGPSGDEELGEDYSSGTVSSALPIAATVVMEAHEGLEDMVRAVVSNMMPIAPILVEREPSAIRRFARRFARRVRKMFRPRKTARKPPP